MYNTWLREPAQQAVNTLLTEIPEHHWGVPGDDMDVLASLQRLSESTRILQLGTAYGLSAIVLGDLAAQMSPTPSVVTVDPSREMNAATQRYLDLAGLHDVVRVVEGTSTDRRLLQSLGRDWHMIFLDTTHQYDQTMREVALLTTMCSERTLLVLHDASRFAADTLDERRQGGVARVVREWCWQYPRWSSFTFQSPPFGKYGIAVMQKAPIQ